MTYYGRWTYKYEIAAQKGAAAAIIIHETEPAAYPWQVVRSSWGKENFELDNPNKNMDAISARSWITLEVAKKLFADCGQDFDALKKSAITKEFRPVALNAKANVEIKQEIRSFKSHNVIGKLEGDDPKLRDEYIICTAHWDPLGRHPELQGDQIFNGAIDNASGVASVIQLAAAFKKLNPPPKRSVLFMATTAEEAGLLGAKYYAEHPLYPLEKTFADLNIDGINPWGKTHDLEDLTDRNSTLDDLLGEAGKAASIGWTVSNLQRLVSLRCTQPAALRSSANRRSTVNRSAMNLSRNIIISRPMKLTPHGICPAPCRTFNFSSKSAIKSPTVTNSQNGKREASLKQNAIRCLRSD